MKPLGQIFYRMVLITIVALVACSIAVPFQGAAGQTTTPTSDDFNRCSPNTSLWEFENPANIAGASPTISGQFTGDSILKISIPAAERHVFSGSGQEAPRIMQSMSDQNFEAEVRFMAPIISTTSVYRVMGILVRDASTTSPARWLRFDYNSVNSGLNTYLGYINESGNLVHIQNVKSITSQSPASGPLVIRVKYEVATGTWTITYVVGNSGSITKTVTFLESDLGINFKVTDIGLFVASTGGDIGSDPQLFTMQVDYFKNTASTSFVDDGIVLSVDTNGSGTVNWPMTSANQCSGSRTVSLTAQPASGNNFVNWTGDISSSQATIDLEMTASKHVIANFTGGGVPIEDLKNKTYLPLITHR